jgi:hypothetical protein
MVPAKLSARRSAPRVLSAVVVAALALGAGVAMAPAASAQEQSTPQTLSPPTPPSPQGSGGLIVPTIIAVVLAGLVLGASAIPSKRGHQD